MNTRSLQQNQENATRIVDVPRHLPRVSKLGVVDKPTRSNNARLRQQALGSTMFSEQAWAEIARSLRLSACELQIVRDMFDDRTECAIATDLGTSPDAVYTCIEHLRHKLAVIDRAELILCVTDQFLALTATPQSVLPSICANRTAGRCPPRRATERA